MDLWVALEWVGRVLFVAFFIMAGGLTGATVTAARGRGWQSKWIAPPTPPPPNSVVSAALTTASTRCSVMSP